MLDSSGVTGSETLVVLNHELSVDRIRPMVMINILGGGGIGMMTIGRMIHDY